MGNPTVIVWSLAWSVLVGVFITAALVIPAAQPHLGQWIIGAIIASAVLAIPISRSVGRTLRS